MRIPAKLSTLIAGVGLIGAVAVVAAPTANAAPAAPQIAFQTISGWQCQSVAVPATYGTFTHCVNFAESKDTSGQWVAIPYQCKGTNNSGWSVTWYRESQYAYSGTLEGNAYPPTYDLANGQTVQFTCSGSYQWIGIQYDQWVRASLQRDGQTQTTGVNVHSPW